MRSLKKIQDEPQVKPIKKENLKKVKGGTSDTSKAINPDGDLY